MVMLLLRFDDLAETKFERSSLLLSTMCSNFVVVVIVHFVGLIYANEVHTLWWGGLVRSVSFRPSLAFNVEEVGKCQATRCVYFRRLRMDSKVHSKSDCTLWN